MANKNLIRVALAWSVHLFTATGAVWGFLSLLAVFDHNWRLAIFWMIIAMIVDSFDGLLARWLDVKTYANSLDGGLLDNIIDYLNYVVVPGLFLFEAPNMLPRGFQLVGAISILLTSAYQFTQIDAKTEDHFFKGFPSYWNVAVIYMLLLKLNPWINLSLLVALNGLVFVPVKYVYPNRNTKLRRLTLTLSYLYGALGIWGLIQYPNVPQWIVWVSFVYVFYYLALSLWPQRREAQPL
jgi:phosphatidylcholine synthase